MEIGILRTGAPPGDLEARFGSYEAMFARLLGPDFNVRAYDVVAGALPDRPDAHPAFLITGSPAGVYEPLPWIAPLLGFLREAKGRSKLVGICFGHQAMAEAYGGRVEKSERGWAAGLQPYELVARRPWMGDRPPARIAVPVSHQDRVVIAPPDAEVLAHSPFSPFGMLAWGSDALSMQFHPEFEPDYAKALIEYRRARLPAPDAAIASLDAPDDRAVVAGWIRAFLKGNSSPAFAGEGDHPKGGGGASPDA
ncbi:MAG TPA: type 1 glutamine amidotransferase [Allosphingosinicella sp.]|jgi:GMP synthase-like glutamine amidotransferase